MHFNKLTQHSWISAFRRLFSCKTNKKTICKALNSIRFRLPLMFIVMVLVPTILVSVIFSKIELDGSRKRILNQLESIVTLKNSSINVWVRSLKADLAGVLISENIRWHTVVVLSDSPSMELLLDTSDSKIDLHFRKLLEQTRRFDTLLLVDLKGKVRFSTRPELEGIICNDQEFFRKGQQAFFITPMFQISSPEQWSIVASQPVFDDKERLVGIVVGISSMDRLNEIMSERSGLGETGETYLVNREYTLLTESRFSKDSHIALDNEKIYKHLTQGKKRFGMYDDYRGQPVIEVNHHLPDLRLILLAKQDQSEAFQSTYTALQLMVVITVVVVGIAMFVGSVLTHSITAQLSELVYAAEKISAGDFDVTATVTKANEIGDLARSFNIMTATVNESFQKIQTQNIELTEAQKSLEAANIQLEERVAERTTELTTANARLQQQISDREQAEEALKIAYHRLNQIIEFLPDPTFVIDQQGRVEAWNRELAELTGISAENIIGKGDHEYALPFYGQRRSILIDLVINYDQTLTSQYESLRREGDKLVSEALLPDFRDRGATWLWGVAAPLYDKTGLVVGAIETIRDITDRVEAEKALRHSEERYKSLYKKARETEELYHSLLDSTLDPIVMYDLIGNVSYVNNAFTETFGWIKEELTDGVPYTPESEKEITKINVTRVIRDGLPKKDFETKRLTKDGDLIDVNISASRFNDHENNPAGMLVILRDITERKLAEEKLRKYAETQEVLLREVNHRVKNNLTAIVGMLLKEQDRAEAEEMADYINALAGLQGRIEGLSTVHTLLSASGWRPLLLSRLCEEVIHAALQGVPFDVNISMNIQDSPIRVNSNQAHHLTLVINELVTNTLKYARGDRDSVRIAVEILQENKNVQIAFCDDGPGYPQEMTEGNFTRANIGFELINGIVGESLRGRVILNNENGAVTTIVFKHDTV